MEPVAADDDWLRSDLDSTLPLARISAGMKDGDHYRSLAVNEVKDAKGKSVQKRTT